MSYEKKRNQRILIIDDDSQVWTAYEAILAPVESTDRMSRKLAAGDELVGHGLAVAGEGETFELTFSPQGKEGCHLVQEMRIQETPFAVAFIDMRMPPGWDGLQTAVKIRQIDPDVEIVMVTAYGDYSLAEIVTSVGCPEKLLILRKPFDPEEIAQLALSLTEKWNLWVEQRSQKEELEKAYGQLKAAHAQMIEQEKMAAIGLLAAGVAHEINNPLGFVTSNIGSLQKYCTKLSEYIEQTAGLLARFGEGELGRVLQESRKNLKIDFILEDIPELLKDSIEGTEQIKVIVQGLKKFSRSDESVLTLSDINECLDSTIKVIWNELKYKATVVKEYGAIPQTMCYPQQLGQVFMNLLVNAAQAMEQFGEIHVKTWQENDVIFASIADTGPGIAADKLQKIFEPFYTTKEAGNGTGLGLSIVRDIVTQQHGGAIGVESEVGKGTIFTVQLPCKK